VIVNRSISAWRFLTVAGRIWEGELALVQPGCDFAKLLLLRADLVFNEE
jgi:hypothetical protein